MMDELTQEQHLALCTIKRMSDDLAWQIEHVLLPQAEVLGDKWIIGSLDHGRAYLQKTHSHTQRLWRKYYPVRMVRTDKRGR